MHDDDPRTYGTYRLTSLAGEVLGYVTADDPANAVARGVRLGVTAAEAVPVDASDVRALANAAVRAGDLAQDVICREALRGDADAWADCCYALLGQ